MAVKIVGNELWGVGYGSLCLIVNVENPVMPMPVLFWKDLIFDYEI